MNNQSEKKKMSKKKKRIIFILLGILILVGASVYTVAIRPKLNEVKVVYEPTTVQRGSVTVTVNESGSIEYEQSSIVYDLDLDVSDDDDDDDEEETTTKYLVIEEVYKASGEIVSEGDDLFKFSAGSIESVRKILASAVADAQVDYNDAKSEYELSCLEAETDYKTQLINAEYANKLYSDASSRVSDNISALQAEISNCESKVSSLQEAIDEAQESYNEAYSNYIEVKTVYDSMDPGKDNLYLQYQKNYLNAQNSYSNALSALERAQDALANNSSQISSLKRQLSSAKASKEMDSISAKQTYEESVQSGENAYLVYTASLESLAEDLEEAEEKLKEREEQQKAFEDLVGEDGVVHAPKEGMLVSVNVEEGDKMTNEKTMVSYVCADSLTISVDVTEEDIVSLSIGDSVDIVFTAYKDEHFEGVIKSIKTTATSSDTNTVSYSVVIGLDGILSRMYGGMTANVAFEVDRSDDTLFISRKALVESNGSYYVYVKSGVGEYELKKVTIGLKNTSYVEIISGLNENDTIYILTTGA